MSDKLPERQSPLDMWILVGRYILCYTLWFLICAVGLWIVMLLRTNVVEDILSLRLNPWQLRAVDRGIIFGLGALWIVIVFLIEGYLRRALAQGRLFISAGRVLLLELIVVGLSLFIHWI